MGKRKAKLVSVKREREKSRLVGGKRWDCGTDIPEWDWALRPIPVEAGIGLVAVCYPTCKAAP